jgi:hypothetical protein
VTVLFCSFVWAILVPLHCSSGTLVTDTWVRLPIRPFLLVQPNSSHLIVSFCIGYDLPFPFELLFSDGLTAAHLTSDSSFSFYAIFALAGDSINSDGEYIGCCGFCG